MTTRVLIVEDHNLLRKGLESLIAGMLNYDVVGEARDGKEAIQQSMTVRPDLILMDLSMPCMSGFEATTHIKRRLPSVKVIILTMSSNDEFVREALRIGADGYILKGSSFDEFAMAMDTVISGKRFICNEISLRMVSTFLNPESHVQEKTEWEKLNERERSILKLIAEGNTNKSAGEFLCISSKTVEKHRASLMRKLSLHNAADLVMAAVEMGVIERPARMIGHGVPLGTCVAPEPRMVQEQQAAPPFFVERRATASAA